MLAVALLVIVVAVLAACSGSDGSQHPPVRTVEYVAEAVEPALTAAPLATTPEPVPTAAQEPTTTATDPSPSTADMDGEALAALNQSAMLQIASYRFGGDYVLEPLVGVPGQARIEGWYSRSPQRLWVRMDSTSPRGRSVEVLMEGETIYVRDPGQEAWYESPAEEFGFDDGSALLQATFLTSIPRVPEISEVQVLEDLYSVSYTTPEGSVVISYDSQHRTREVLVSGTMSLTFSDYDSEAELPTPDVAGPVPDGYFANFWQ